MKTIGARKQYGIAYVWGRDERCMNVSAFMFDTQEEAEAVAEALNASPSAARYCRARVIQFGDTSYDDVIRDAAQRFTAKTFRVAVCRERDSNWPNEPKGGYTFVEGKGVDKSEAWHDVKKRLGLNDHVWNPTATVEVAA